MKYLFLFTLLFMFACRRERDMPQPHKVVNHSSEQQRGFICMPLPADAIFKKASEAPTSLDSNTTKPIPAKGWVVDYDAFSKLFNSDTVQVYNYLRARAATVHTVQLRAGIQTGISYCYIFKTPDTLNGNLYTFSKYCAENLVGKVPADGFNLLSYSYYEQGGGGISWIGGINTVNYNCCVCGINGLSTWQWQAAAYPSLSYSWDDEVICHEEGHLFFGLLHTHNPSWNGNNTKLDDCGGELGLIEENTIICSEPNLQGCLAPDTPYIVFDTTIKRLVLFYGTCTFPLDSGLVMSYCHDVRNATSGKIVGISLIQGYGAQAAVKAMNYLVQNQQYLYFYKHYGARIREAFNY